MKFEIGQKAESVKVITQEDIKLFGVLSGDKNPIHFDSEYAKTTPFQKVIAPGLYVASFISAVLANQLPGPGSIYLSQEVRFMSPVFIGDAITTQVEVLSVRNDKNILELLTVCKNQSGQVVLKGKALVKV